MNSNAETMNEKRFFKIRLYFTALVTVAIWSLLVWNHFHGGVPSHHIAADKDMPAISNWCGALLLPLLTWLLLHRIQRRVFASQEEASAIPGALRHVVYRFVGALLFGVLIAVLFTFGYNDVTGNLVLGLLPLAILFPLYRAECLLGFVLAMTFTFGAVLPTAFGSFLILVGLVLYRFVRPALLYILSKVVLLASLSKQKPHP